MISMGIDVGAETLKLAIMEDKKVIHSDLLITEEGGEEGSRQIVERALGVSDLKESEIGKVIATGIGRKAVSFAHETKTEAICHAKGTYWFFPSARTVIDVGAQGSRAIRLGDDGKVIDFAETSKCASGSGFFLEQMGKVLKVPLEQMGEVALSAPARVDITNYCSVFAESEVISKIHAGESVSSILAGLHHSLALRFFDLLMKVGVREDLVMTGGGAKNEALVKEIEGLTGRLVHVPSDPQMVGAIGAALFGQA
jgi:predicted CoA-substrate-specific enzyme activase